MFWPNIGSALAGIDWDFGAQIRRVAATYCQPVIGTLAGVFPNLETAPAVASPLTVEVGEPPDTSSSSSPWMLDLSSIHLV